MPEFDAEPGPPERAPHYHLLTIFPDIFQGFLKASLIGKAIEAGFIRVSLLNIRDYADPPHYKVDDSPYGGGAGMVMKPEPIARAILKAKESSPAARVILLSPAGQPFSQKKAVQLSGQGDLILVCGRYEGVDQRAIDLYVDEEISAGDYVLMGGEVPAMVVMEAAVRLMKDVIGNMESLTEESFSILEGDSLLIEAPHYTKPAEFEGRKVPETLLTGNHKKISEWRREQALARTKKVRPDLLLKRQPS